MTKYLSDKYPTYEAKLKALHTLIDIRGDSSYRLTTTEREEYEHLTEWYNDNH